MLLNSIYGDNLPPLRTEGKDADSLRAEGMLSGGLMNVFLAEQWADRNEERIARLKGAIELLFNFNKKDAASFLTMLQATAYCEWHRVSPFVAVVGVGYADNSEFMQNVYSLFTTVDDATPYFSTYTGKVTVYYEKNGKVKEVSMSESEKAIWLIGAEHRKDEALRLCKAARLWGRKDLVELACKMYDEAELEIEEDEAI